MPHINWSHWPVDNQNEVSKVLAEHFSMNFNRECLPLKHKARKKKKFQLLFLAQLAARGGTVKEATRLLHDLTAIHDVGFDCIRSSRSLCVQYPHSRHIVAGRKKLELRKNPLGLTFKGLSTAVYVNESMAKRPKVQGRPFELPMRCRAPGQVIGEVCLTGTFTVLAPVLLTEKMAVDAMLTLEGLKEAYSSGYKYAWHLSNPKEYACSFLAKAQSNKKRMAQVWTLMSRAPLKRLKKAGRV